MKPASMKSAILPLLLLLCLGACAAKKPLAEAPAVDGAAAYGQTHNTDGSAKVFSGGAEIETVPFRFGVSSATVENLAKQQACTGGRGAGLVTEQGPVEVYRMVCDNGKVFQARCELRQCRAF